jgi:hypothetical protein
MKVTEFVIDNTAGLGLNQRHSQIAEFGLKVMMKPSAFLELAPRLFKPHDDNQTYINNWVSSKQPIAAPVMRIAIPSGWFHNNFADFYVPYVRGHEGRHRMRAILSLEGNIPVETYLYFNDGDSNEIVPRSKLTPKMIKLLNKQIIPQAFFGDSGRAVRGPFFTLK